MKPLPPAQAAWERELSARAPSTGLNYRLYLAIFMKRWGYDTHEQLYERRISDLASDDPRTRKGLQDEVRTLMAEHERAGKAPSTCRNVYKAVRAFMKSQGLEESFKLKRTDMPRGAHNGQLVIQPEQILELYHRVPEVTLLRTRAQLMFLKDSGLRISDLATLDVGDWQEAERLEEEAGTFMKFSSRRTLKSGAIAHMIVGPETFDAVELYLEEREEAGEILRAEAPLFLNRYGERMSSKNVGVGLLRLTRKLKANKKISAHSLRKFHVTQLQVAGVPDSWVKKLQGRMVTDSFGVYSQPEANGELMKAYVRAYGKLRVLTPERSDTPFGVVGLQEVEQLRAQVRELESGGRERRIDELERQVEKLTDLLEHIYKTREL